MNFWTPANIQSLTRGQWLVEPPADLAPMGAAIDSRTLQPGQLFFAMRGEYTDGHRFLPAVLQRLASISIIDSLAAIPAGLIDEAQGRMGVLQVPSVHAALLTLGGEYRKTLTRTRVISIGGSNGKTTTTRLVHAALSTTLRGTSSPKSFNNDIGVPLTILNAKADDDYLLCEVGTNAPGEIALLAKLVKPDVAVITSIGREHLEGLGSLGGVVREESAILSEIAPGGAAIVNTDAPLLLDAATKIVGTHPGTKLRTFGIAPTAEFRIGSVEPTRQGVVFTINKHRASVQLLGRHNALNAAAAFAVGVQLGLAESDIVKGLAIAKGPDMRMQRTAAQGIEFFNDAYNANPDSMLAAIATFTDLCLQSHEAPGRRIAILGDMLELGDAAPQLHREIGQTIAASPFDAVHFVGPLSRHAADVATRTAGPAIHHHAAATADTCHAIAQTLATGDIVLLKGSRGMKLERILQSVLDSANLTAANNSTC